MSEIKGQLLGIILTIAIFGVVLTAMVTSFGKMNRSIPGSWLPCAKRSWDGRSPPHTPS